MVYCQNTETSFSFTVLNKSGYATAREVSPIQTSNQSLTCFPSPQQNFTHLNFHYTSTLLSKRKDEPIMVLPSSFSIFLLFNKLPFKILTQSESTSKSFPNPFPKQSYISDYEYFLTPKQLSLLDSYCSKHCPNFSSICVPVQKKALMSLSILLTTHCGK